MITNKEILIDDVVFNAIELNLSDSSKFLLISGSKGYIACGYLNIEIAQKRGDIACVATGVKTAGDLLDAKIVALTENAEKIGIKTGMVSKDALKILAKISK